MSLTNISNSIPITISGLGLREGFAIHFLKDFGFGAEQAVAATLSVFLMHDVIPALVGAIVLLRARKV
jgi:glycosyltransferase 2 family protein